MKTCKRFLSVLLVVLMLICAVPVMEVNAISCRKDYFDKSRYTLTGDMAYDVAMIAKSQKDRTRSDFGYTENWCDEFVADCIENAGGDDSIVAHGGTVADFEEVLRNRGSIEVTSPQTGDLVFFTWSHVEIITKVENGVPYCAGGNNGDSPGSCKGERKVSSVGSYRLFLRPNYRESYVNLGNDFYANILKYDGWATIGYSSENDNVQIVPAAGQASEYWHFVRDEDGSYAIYNCSNNLALEVCGSGTENGTNVNVWPDWGGANQRWYIKGHWSGEFYLCPKNTDKVLDVDASLGTNVQIWEKNEGASQKLSIYITTPKASFYGNHVDIGDDFYANILKYDGWATIGYSSENDNVQIVPAAGQASEFWHFVKDADGAYAIYNCSNNLALEVSGSGTENGTNVNVLTDWGGANQRWFVSGPWNGEYYLTPKNTDKVLDVDASLGTNLQIWEKNDTSAQKFSIYGQPKAGVSTLSVTTANGRADFSWTEASNADSYNIRIKNTVTGDTVDIYKETGTSKTVYLESGQYVAYIDSCNVYSFTKSNEVLFTIVHTHSYNSAVTTPATCSSTGLRTYTCTCGDSYTETIGKNSNNHINTTNVGATDSSCTVKGYSAGVYCNDCKQYISGHDEQPLAAHQTTVINAREATYDADGYTGDTYCTVCRQTLSYGSSIPKLTKPNEPTNPTNPTQPTSQQQQQSGNCKYCGGTHTGFPGIIIGFIHSILAMFGLHK